MKTEISEYSKQHYLVQEKDVNRDNYPELYNISSAFFYDLVPRPIHTSTPEFVYFDLKAFDNAERAMQIYEWNLMWEAGHLRQNMFYEKLPEEIRRACINENDNIYLLPFHKDHHYHAYASLFHLIPSNILKYNNLPLLKKGIWPVGAVNGTDNLFIPKSFDARLAQAFSYHIWPLIDPGSRVSAFSKDDSLRILSHNLDFWLPSIFKVVENRLSLFERVDIEDERQRRKLAKARRELPLGVEAVRPLKGGIVWSGEEEAWEATEEMVELADSSGKLRAIIDAIKSNRVEEDFSDIWSNAREDFERKIYKKRSRIKVVFVELDETIPVHGPDSELHESLLWEDFFGILDQKEKRIVVCLRNGTTKMGDIAKEMGYANHSPVSKALIKIRKKAEMFLND